MNIADYKRKIVEIKKQIELVKEDDTYLKDFDSVEKLENLLKHIDDEQFKLIVVGEFSRGKSMFVNAIIGENLLPSSKNPTTATLNVIENGTEQAEFFLNYADGSNKKIPKEEFKSIIAPECQGSSKKAQMDFLQQSIEIQKIHHVQVKVLNELGQQNVTIVDTPGVNDLDARREQITYDYIPNSDAAIVVCSATQQLTASEFKFIHERILENDISKLFVVINFKDLLHNEEDCKKVIDLFCEKLKKIVPPKRIFLVSSKQALTYKRKCRGEELKSTTYLPDSLEETGFVELEKELLSFLAEERGSIRIERFKMMLHSICQDMLHNILPQRINAVAMSREEIELRIRQLKPQIEQKRLKCQNALDSMQRDILKKEIEFADEYRKLLDALANRAKRTVENYYGNSPDELFEVMSDSTASLEKKIQTEFPGKIQDVIMKIVEESLQRIGDDFLDIGIRMNVLEGLGTPSSTSVAELKSSEMDVADYTQRDYEVGKLVVGGIIGGVALIALAGAIASGGLLVAPFLHAGGKILSSIVDAENKRIDEKYQNEENITVTNASVKKVFLAEVEKRYFTSISKKVEIFQAKYKQNVYQLTDVIKKDCEVKLEQVVWQLENELSEKQERSWSIEEERLRLSEIEKHLNQH